MPRRAPSSHVQSHQFGQRNGSVAQVVAVHGEAAVQTGNVSEPSLEQPRSPLFGPLAAAAGTSLSSPHGFRSKAGEGAMASPNGPDRRSRASGIDLMAAKLVVRLPGGQCHDFPLRQPVTTIGRAPTCDLVLEYDYMSRLHARLESTPSGYMVIDAGSTNGTAVNGRRIGHMQMLSSGDEIAMGEIAVVFFDVASQEGVPTVFRPMPADCPIRCDSSSWEVWVGEQQLDMRLSVQEFELLSLLTSRYGKVCTREELGTAIWGRGNYTHNMLHRVVHRLKLKLASLQEWIASVPGVGYKIDRPAA